ncbi:hypothetical protein [Roseobacter sp. CCS2]|uniref:hypothetical protein n=1 Tax=Roseobacter sp. CCS2 TaxID=391593 RepID=UPI0000F3C50B|nr:hypothetical protein [Roseobacter sp. CCS2]EBA11902.1 hypothetical protein RCCS2_18276 [Roseobacter sp. CCS2]
MEYGKTVFFLADFRLKADLAIAPSKKYNPPHLSSAKTSRLVSQNDPIWQGKCAGTVAIVFPKHACIIGL